MERLLAAIAGMSSTMYLMACLLAWYRVFSPGKSNDEARKVIPDRAVAWTGLFGLFGMIALEKLGLINWSDYSVMAFTFVFLSAVYWSGLVSIRAITIDRYGNFVLMVFVAASLAVGATILMV